MGDDRQARRAQRKAAIAAAVAAPPTVLGDGQRRVVFGLLLAGLALAGVGLLVPPRGAGYWVALLVALLLAAVMGYVLGGGPGRALDARLAGVQPPQVPPRAMPPAALAPPLRLALQTAMLPALLAALRQAADGMNPRTRAAALALVEAGATAPAGAPRDALARDLPRLLAALRDGDEAAMREAEGLAARLAAPGGGA